MHRCSDRLLSLYECLKPCRPIGREQIRRVSYRPLQSQAKLRKDLQPDHAALIDPKDLHGTLKGIRAANRTRNIRKVDNSYGPSSRLSLPNILGLQKPSRSEDAADIELVEQARSHRRDYIKRKWKLAAMVKKDARLLSKTAVRRLVPGWEMENDLWLPVRHRTPWLLSLTESERDESIPAQERLSNEIRAFSTFIAPRAEDRTVTDDIIGSLRAACASSQMETEIEAVGSRASGLAGQFSDIDLTVRPSGEDGFDKMDGRGMSLMLLRQVARNMRSTDSQGMRLSLFTTPRVLSNPRVPILKTIHIASGLEIEMQCANDSYNGLAYAKSFQRDCPTVRSVFMVLRHALIIRGLKDGSMGGLSSYPLLNMVVAAYKSLEARKGMIEPGEHLLEFLDLFSSVNFHNEGISVVPFVRFQLVDGLNEEHFPRRTGDGKMCLVDPADPSNNLGSAFHRTKAVQAVFRDMNISIRAHLAKWDSRNDGGEIEEAISGQSDHDAGAEQSLLRSLLLADWRQYLTARDLLQELVIATSTSRVLPSVEIAEQPTA